MPRILLAALAALILVLPATAEGQSGLRLRGTVALKVPAQGLVTVRAQQRAVVLHVPGSLARIRIGQRVELRGSTLRSHGNGSRVLARNVSIAGSQALPHNGSPAPAPRDDDEIEADDDELEVKGTLTKLSPLTVTAAGRAFICAVPTGVSLTGFAVGDFVEMTCDLIGGSWMLRELEHEDDEDEDDDNCGPGNVDDDDDEDDDSSGRGNGDDGDDDDDNCGPGNGDDDDDDDDDSSGPGGGDDDD